MDVQSEMLPDGLQDYTNRLADDMTQMLEKNSLPYLDLREQLSATPQQVKENFMITDHHWNVQGAFRGWQLIMDRLRRDYPQENLPPFYTDLQNWQLHEKKNWSLGSSGRRVGKYYAGTDDARWLTPKFDVQLSTAMPYSDELWQGSFEDAVLSMRHVQSDNCFYNNSYVIYMGRDYPLVQHRNPKAPSDMKILIIKDSFALPVQAFMATVFKQVDVIDPRSFRQVSMAQYIQATEPDLVMLLYNPRALLEDVFVDFKQDLAAEQNRGEGLQEVFSQELVEIPAGSEEINGIRMVHALQPNTKYTLYIQEAAFTQGEGDVFSIDIMGIPSMEKQICRIADLKAWPQDGDSWTFYTSDKTDEDMDILVYSGLRGQSANKTLQLKNVKLYRHGAAGGE